MTNLAPPINPHTTKLPRGFSSLEHIAMQRTLIGELERVRIALGVTRKQFANDAGVDHAYYSRNRRLASSMSMRTIIAFCSTYNLRLAIREGDNCSRVTNGE